MMNYYVHNLDPIALTLLGIPFPWYWLVYFCGYFWMYWFFSHLKKKGLVRLSHSEIYHFLLVGFFVLLFSGKLFYILFYNLSYYLEEPRKVFYLWEGGMSFHGALIGCSFWIWFYSKKIKKSIWSLADPLATGIPCVLFFGRIANFINGELAGRISDIPWAVIFPKLYDHHPRHPSQIYEALFEGVFLFIYMWLRRNELHKPGKQSICFLFLYGLFRFIIEYFRLPDAQIGLVLGLVSVGQVYCLLMMLWAFYLFIYRKA